MSRTVRLLELLVRLQSLQRFNAQELATEFNVSRRTMIRDLQALSELGVPLASSSGPHGGYQLIRNQPLPALTLSRDEAIALVVSYESVEQCIDSPFNLDKSAAMAKVLNTLPPDVVEQIHNIQRHISMVGPQKPFRAPHLRELLGAAVDKSHVRIRYETRSGQSDRVIFPYGLFAENRLWYCACFDYKRGMHVSLRADRILDLVGRVNDASPPNNMNLHEWLEADFNNDANGLSLDAYIPPESLRFTDWSLFTGHIQQQPDGSGLLSVMISQNDLDFYTRLFTRIGTDARVLSPQIVVDAIRKRLTAILQQYDNS